MLGMRPVKTPIAVRLNTVDHIAPAIRLRHEFPATVIGVAESGAPELPHRLQLRFEDGTETVLHVHWVDFTDISRVPASHLGHRNATIAWIVIEALREANGDNPYSRYHSPAE